MPDFVGAIQEQLLVRYFKCMDAEDPREVKTALEIYDRLRIILEPQFAALAARQAPTDTQSVSTYDPLKDLIEAPEEDTEDPEDEAL